MLFEGGTPSQQAILARVLEKHHLSLSLQMYGCRVVQKVSISARQFKNYELLTGSPFQAVEFVSEEQQAAIVQELEPHVMRCVMDANGNHVGGTIGPFYVHHFVNPSSLTGHPEAYRMCYASSPTLRK